MEFIVSLTESEIYKSVRIYIVSKESRAKVRKRNIFSSKQSLCMIAVTSNAQFGKKHVRTNKRCFPLKGRESDREAKQLLNISGTKYRFS